MFKYKCVRCGRLWYSAADIKHMTIRSCEKCGGRLAEYRPVKKTVFPKKPVWGPLVSVVGDRSREFMFMGQVPLGQIWVYLYKHTVTRRYINLDGNGRAYLYTPDGYVPISIEEAIDRVFG